MWIRSQDRTNLEDVQDFYIRLIKNKQCTINTGRGHILGTYSSKEKALKVLDMIQKHLMGFPVSGCSQLSKNCPMVGIECHHVFEMPQDWSVE